MTILSNPQTPINTVFVSGLKKTVSIRENLKK